MIDYASQITNLRLVKLLDSCIDRDDLRAADITELKAMIVKAANEAGKLLALIPVTFKQYTAHDIGHVHNLVSLMGKFIPDATLNQLNALEITLLVLSALLHDFGMYVTDEERNVFLTSEDFKHLLIASPDKADALQQYRDAGDHVRARVIEDVLIADYFRLLHPRRAQENIQKYLPNILTFRDFSLVDAIGEICESHGWGVFESADPRKPENVISRLRTRSPVNGIPVNPQYIAVCLRLADIMDFDRSRTPLSLLKTITESRSQAEWQKHLQIDGWTIDSRDVTFYASCAHPEHFVAVNDFLDAIDDELASCHRLIVKEAPKPVADRYTFELPRAVDRSNVEMADKRYVAGAFKFYLDYERIMRLLMDKSLYPEPSFFLRELLQNALDACRHRKALADAAGFTQYAPAITITDNSDAPEPTVVVEDNGVGMSLSIVQNYFMRVGRSYYKSPEFAAERQRLSTKNISLEATSQFGIGILSCFMVADQFDVETYRAGQRPLRMTIEGPTRYFLICLLDQPAEADFKAMNDGPPNSPGTRITVRLRSGTSIDVREVICQFATNVDAPVTIIKHNDKFVIGTFEAETAQTAEVEFARSFAKRGSPIGPYFDLPEGIEGVQFAELRTLMSPLFVDFQKFEFSSHIRGTAWFWLLRDAKGNFTPSRGFVRFGPEFEVHGVPEIFAQLVRGDRGNEMRLSDLLHTYIEADTNDQSVSTNGRLYHVAEFWLQSTLQLRERIINWVRQVEPLYYNEKAWFTVPGLPTILAEGGDRWLDQPFTVTSSIGYPTMQSVSLYGIAVPASITTWQPAEGVASRISMTTASSGFAIDLRGSVSPTPAASRLFFDMTEGAKVSVPLQRAMIRTAFITADEHGYSPEWRDWSHSVLRRIARLFYSGKALLLERDCILKYLPISVRIANQWLDLTASEVLNHFGPVVPFADSVPDNNGLGVGFDDWLFALGHPIIKTGKSTAIDTRVSNPIESNQSAIDIQQRYSRAHREHPPV